MSLKGKGPVENLNRYRKAKMIEAFLKDALDQNISSFKILDVGCGNGQISSYFAEKNYVVGVDVEDKNLGNEKIYQFKLIKNEQLPFDDDEFDIVISHHVIEHVNDQELHLAEIHRVLKINGLVYIGCPNGGSPFMAGHKGNKMVPNRKKIIALINDAKFEWVECYTKLLSDPDRYYCELKIGKYLPSKFIKLFQKWYPGHCFILKLA